MSELPLKMETLNISEDDDRSVELDSQCVDSEKPATALCSPRRILRKRIANTSVPILKRRCKLPPKKFPVGISENGSVSLDELVTLYENKGACGTKTIKCLLETIYEEPKKLRNGSLLSVGITKIKRTINFPDLGCVSKRKQRKRKAKARLLSKWSPNKTGMRRVSLDNLLSKLELEEHREQTVGLND